MAAPDWSSDLGPDWETDSSEHSRYRFYTSSSNKDEKSHSVRFNLPAFVVNEVRHLIETRQIPQYRTTADFFRDAAMHRLHDVKDMVRSETLPATLDLFRVLEEQNRRLDEMKLLQEIVTNNQHMIEMAVLMGDRATINEIVEGSDQMFRKVREPWRSRAIEQVKKYAEEKMGEG